jgi:hypothetical protein
MYPTPLQISSGNGVADTSLVTAVAAQVLPTNSAGERPKFVYVSGGGGAFHISFGSSGLADATVADFLVPDDNGVIFNVSGQTHFSHIRNGAANVDIVVYALDNEGGLGTP